MTTQPSAARPAITPTRVISAVWLLLVVITVASWWLAPGHTTTLATASVPITIAAITLGMIKSRLIIRYFMEVRTAPTWLKRSTDGWLIVLWTSVLIIYLV